MNIKEPERCDEGKCDKITEWVTPSGVNDTAADLKNMQHEEMKDTLNELDTNLDVFKKYEDALIAKEKEANDEVDQGFKEFEKGLEEMEKEFEKDTGVTPQRILATTDDVVLVETDDSNVEQIPVGEDEQITDDEADAVETIDETEPTAAIDAINNVDENDGTVVGEDSTDLDDKEESGWSMLTWLMVVGGALALLSICALGAFLVMQNKDAQDSVQTGVLANA